VLAWPAPAGDGVARQCLPVLRLRQRSQGLTKACSRHGKPATLGLRALSCHWLLLYLLWSETELF
jgi:hypothetical protein